MYRVVYLRYSIPVKTSQGRYGSTGGPQPGETIYINTPRIRVIREHTYVTSACDIGYNHNGS